MFDAPWQTFATMCNLCTVYTLASEQSKALFRYAGASSEASMALASLQSVGQVLVFGVAGRRLSRAGMRACWLHGALYTLNIWLPIAATWLGCDALSLLVLKTASPVLVGLLRPREATAGQWVATLLASLGTALVGHEQLVRALAADGTGNGGFRLGLGLACAVAGTTAACCLSDLQERTRNRGQTVDEQMTHMHAWCLPTFALGALPIARWLAAAPWWLWTSATLLQWQCSVAIVHVNREPQLGARGGQVGLAARRAVSVVIVAYLAAQPVSPTQLGGLALAVVAAMLFQACGARRASSVLKDKTV